MIAFENVDFAFDRRTIFKNLNLKVQPGEFVSLLGPSGSGKSTLLRLASGLLNPSRGRVYRENAEMGFVFQEPRLLGWRNIAENVALPLDLKNKSQAPVEGALQAVGLTPAKALYPHQLSGGMKQRASLARALALDPKVLFFDEPLSALDEPTRNALQKQIYELWRQKKFTAVFVTHSISEALFMSERVLVIPRDPERPWHEEKVPAHWTRSEDLRLQPEFIAAQKKLAEVLARGEA